MVFLPVRRAFMKSTRLTWVLFKTCASLVSLILSYPYHVVAGSYLLALSNGILGLDVKLNTKMLETLKLISDTEISKVTFEFLVVADSSLASSLFLAPLLNLCQTVELVADAAARVVVEVREAVEVRGKGERHLC